jgi:hypothetical protein
MYQWPWPAPEVDWFMARARRAVDQPRADDLIEAFMVHLAVGLEEPVENLAAWAKKYSLSGLRREIESVEDVGLRRLAEREAGMPKRRGDLIRIRSKQSWWDIRTK